MPQKTNPQKIVKAPYVLSKECRLQFNAKGEKVKSGEPYILLETTRGKAIFNVSDLPELIKDLGSML